MTLTLPKETTAFMSGSWSEIEPFYRSLEEWVLEAGNLEAYLATWSALAERISEAMSRLRVATTVDTADQAAAERYTTFLETVYPQAEAAEQHLKEKLLASSLVPEGFAVPLRAMREEAALFREENLPLQTDEAKLSIRYYAITGGQTVTWDGKELPINALQPLYQETDRTVRERAWRVEMERRLADRATLNGLWGEFVDVRRHQAANAAFPDYRAYRWRQLQRFDYTPDDCLRFHAAIEEVVVPVLRRLHEERRTKLGVETLRPWDLDVDTQGRSPLHPYNGDAMLQEKTAAIFAQVDPQLGAYFSQMREANLLDLENRTNKAPGGYCTSFDAARQPFIFMNAVGVHDDVQTLLHEGGHAFHVYETAGLPYIQQRQPGAEFAEVASMSMELLAAPFLASAKGGFYSAADAARARRVHLEGIISFWPYMAVVDAFQHWVYSNADTAADPAACDAQWLALWGRFMQGVDWAGLDQEAMTGWQRKLHIFTYPFYYVEYGLAQLGAIQVWANARRDQAEAVAAYRRALALGSTAPLPALFEAAGAHFAFDAATLRAAIDVIEQTLAEL